MYNFIDVNETSGGVSLPSEALKINGEYIENQITGYRTLTVTGREALSPEVSFFDTGNRDGSTLKGKRYPARILKIKYQLAAKTSEEFREAYNKLASILDVTDAELIFDDEPDKFFKGTPSMIGEVTPGRNSVVGEFEIICLDPFKYSVMEYEAVPVLDDGEPSILIDYNGTYKSYPTLQAEFFNEDEASEDGETTKQLTGSGECGYVAFFNEDEKIIQLGDPDEVDREVTYAKSQTLINQEFKKSSSWGTAAKSLWSINSGKTSSSAVEQKGSLGMEAAAKSTASFEKAETVLLEATSEADRPYIHYKVTSKVANRTASQTKIQFTVETRLDNSESYFGQGLGLKSNLRFYFNGKTYDYTIPIKDVMEYWRGTTVHKRTLGITLSTPPTATNLSLVEFEVERTDDNGSAGTLDLTDCQNASLGKYNASTTTAYCLAAAQYGDGNNWHGPSITRVIPADAAGDVGAVNFSLSWLQKMSIGPESNATNQLGAFQVLVVSGSGTNRKIVAGVNIYKSNTGKNANLRFYVNDATKSTQTIDLSHNNKTTTNSAQIIKEGGKITFVVCGKRVSYTDKAIANTAVNEITFTFSQYGTEPALTYNGLQRVTFRKDNCDVWKDIPNKFGANDVVEADCNTGEIFLNGVSNHSYGALGNDWEDFYLKPGLNQIGFSYSSWVEAEYAPTFKVKYREVFL